jgi:hypothetical protein
MCRSSKKKGGITSMKRSKIMCSCRKRRGKLETAEETAAEIESSSELFTIN